MGIHITIFNADPKFLWIYVSSAIKSVQKNVYYALILNLPAIKKAEYLYTSRLTKYMNVRLTFDSGQINICIGNNTLLTFYVNLYTLITLHGRNCLSHIILLIL